MNIGLDIDDTISNTYDYGQKYMAILEENFDKYYENMIKEVKPKMFSVEIINKLKSEGNKIFLITARIENKKFNVKELTIKWLKENNINYDELIINVQDKAKIAQEKNIDIFVDDSISNCESIANTGIKTYIMDFIANYNYKNDKIIRVYSWEHLYQEINKYKEEI